MTLRMRGVFFALATVAVSLAMVQISRHFVDLTGGADGLALKFIGNSLWAMQSRTPAPFLYAGTGLRRWSTTGITRWILNSRFGLEMQAVRDDEVAAAAAGVAVFRTKMLGLPASARVMTAIAGSLYMQFYMAIDPEAAFGLSQAIQLQLAGAARRPRHRLGADHRRRRDDLPVGGDELGLRPSSASRASIFWSTA